jgi:hypothetical protein
MNGFDGISSLDSPFPGVYLHLTTMTSRRFFALSGLAAALSLASCATQSSISLDYAPVPGGSLRGAPIFTVGAFANKRDMDSYQLGTVKLPVGVPIEQLRSASPVETVVANCFAHAMEYRGMLTDSNRASLLITGDVLELYGQLLVHPYAYARIRMNVVEIGSGRVVFSKVYTGERQTTAYRPGSGSPVPILEDLISRALQDAVDRAVDDPAMRSQIQSGSGGYRPRYTPGML